MYEYRSGVATAAEGGGRGGRQDPACGVRVAAAGDHLIISLIIIIIVIILIIVISELYTR